MLKKTLTPLLAPIFIIALTLTLSGCGAEKERKISIEEGQKIFDEAFLNSQKSVDQNNLKKQIALGIEAKVLDNKNDVLPEELENIKSNLRLNYDRSNKENVLGDLVAEIFLNQTDSTKSKPNLSFSAKLADKKIAYILKNFDIKAATFFGIGTLLGGEEGLSAIQKNFVDKENIYPLTDEQYKGLLESIETANSEGDLIVNTKTEEQAITQAFIDNKVIAIKGGKFIEGKYILDFEITGAPLANFLNAVAKINRIERDFSNIISDFENIEISGVAQVSEDKKIIQIEGQIFVDKKLISKAEKDLIIDVNYTIPNPANNHWEIALVDAIKNTKQATLIIDYNMN